MPSVGAVTSNLNVVTKTAAYTAVANDFVLASAASGAVTITLPATPVLNTVVAVKKTDATTSAVSVVPSGAATIDGDTVAILAVANAAITVQFDGTNWRMLSTAEVNTANGVAGLPSGGASGAVLTKNSASNYDASWAAVASGGGGMFQPWTVASRYYLPWPMNNLASVTPTGTSCSCFPVRVPNDCTIATIGLYVYASTTNVAIGLHTDVPTATSSGPGVRVGSSSAKLVTANAYNSWTIGATVKAGNYWIIYGSDANIAVYGSTNVNWLQNWSSGTGPTAHMSMRYLTTQGGGYATQADYSTYASAAASYPVPAFYITVS